jgi:SAM-dependent methyltransferase
MHRRFTIATRWGIPLARGNSVLELGCGDGYLAQIFVQQGLCYCGMDISSSMVAMADRRLKEAGLKTQFLVTDINQTSLSEPVDAVVSYMGAFFTYIRDPLALLQQVRPYVQKKIILDLNPRGNITVRTAAGMMKEAGFRNIAWRPFFVPKEKKLPAPILEMLAACEDAPLLRSIPLRWKFNILIKGEVGSK